MPIVMINIMDGDYFKKCKCHVVLILINPLGINRHLILFTHGCIQYNDMHYQFLSLVFLLSALNFPCDTQGSGSNNNIDQFVVQLT